MSAGCSCHRSCRCRWGPSVWASVSLAPLANWLRDQPLGIVRTDQKPASDIINVAFIGTAEDLTTAFAAAVRHESGPELPGLWRLAWPLFISLSLSLSLIFADAFFCREALDFLAVLLFVFGFSGAAVAAAGAFLVALVCEGKDFGGIVLFAAGAVEQASLRRVDALVCLCGEEDKGGIDNSSSK